MMNFDKWYECLLNSIEIYCSSFRVHIWNPVLFIFIYCLDWINLLGLLISWISSETTINNSFIPWSMVETTLHTLSVHFLNSFLKEVSVTISKGSQFIADQLLSQGSCSVTSDNQQTWPTVSAVGRPHSICEHFQEDGISKTSWLFLCSQNSFWFKLFSNTAPIVHANSLQQSTKQLLKILR